MYTLNKLYLTYEIIFRVHYNTKYNKYRLVKLF